ncbi:membrane protein YoeI [Salmonella enterica subsp. enterica]|nr:membrane protein YoeI [Salmonella enterica subsp. enterica]
MGQFFAYATFAVKENDHVA